MAVRQQTDSYNYIQREKPKLELSKPVTTK